MVNTLLIMVSVLVAILLFREAVRFRYWLAARKCRIDSAKLQAEVRKEIESISKQLDEETARLDGLDSHIQEFPKLVTSYPVQVEQFRTAMIQWKSDAVDRIKKKAQAIAANLKPMTESVLVEWTSPGQGGFYSSTHALVYGAGYASQKALDDRARWESDRRWRAEKEAKKRIQLSWHGFYLPDPPTLPEPPSLPSLPTLPKASEFPEIAPEFLEAHPREWARLRADWNQAQQTHIDLQQAIDSQAGELKQRIQRLCEIKDYDPETLSSLHRVAERVSDTMKQHVRDVGSTYGAPLWI